MTGPDERALLGRLLEPVVGGERAPHCVDALVARFGDVGGAIVAPKDEVARLLNENGEACAARLSDLHSLVLAVVRRKAMSRPLLGSRAALRHYLSTALAGEKREQFRVLYLDSRNGLIHEELAGVGTRDHAPVYPREIIRRALELSASALILVHNHPSGDPTPSPEDTQTTVRIVAAGAVFGIPVHDHLVVGQKRVFSFHDAGLIGPLNGAAEVRALGGRGDRGRRAAVARRSASAPASPSAVHSG